LEGYNPLPLKIDKAPLLQKDHPFLYKRIDLIEKRFKYAEKIGIACGEISGGFYCLDFDNHKGEDIQSVFDDFYNQPPVQYLLKSGLICFYTTMSGGFHCYFKYKNATLKGRTISRWEDNSTMIEIRGNGQYVCCFPSIGYQHVDGCELTELDYIDDEYLNYIIEICYSYSIIPIQDYTDAEKRQWKGEWSNATVDGQYNNESAAEARELLMDHGWSIASKRYDGVEYWVRPGKNPEDGISATWGKRKNMFYVFSSSALPFAEGKAYSPFNIYTILKFNGDWKKAKDSLKPAVEIKDDPVEQIKELFPIDVFPTFISDYILELKRTLNFHPDFTAAAVMFTLATINGNKYKLKVKNGWEAPTIFWFACVGYPGTIKTHPVKTIINPIYKIDKQSKKQYDLELLAYDPDAKNKQPKPKFKQLLISDYTIEALHNIHDYNTRGIGLYKDELVGFLNDMNKYRKGSDEQFWLESFNNGTHIVNRVTKEPLLIQNICINVIGTIQHDVLNDIVLQHYGNGLIDRFLFTSAENKVYELTDQEIDDQFGTFWDSLISKMNRNWFYLKSEDTEIIKMTPEAFKVYQSIDKDYVTIQNSDEVGQEEKNYLSKMKTYVPRFALLLAIMEGIVYDMYIMVEEKHMVNAGRIAQYFIKTAKSVFQNNNEFRDIKSVDSSLKGKTRDERIFAIYEKEISVSEISKYFKISKQHVYRILKGKK
jgi:hypothetical protein